MEIQWEYNKYENAKIGMKKQTNRNIKTKTKTKQKLRKDTGT